MRREPWVGFLSALVLFAACGDERDVVIPPLDGGSESGSARDGSTSQDATSPLADGSPSNDTGVGDGTVGDGTVRDGTVSDGPSDVTTGGDGSGDANSDGASSDAGSSDAGEAGSDANTPSDAGTDAGISPQVLLLDEAFGANTYGGGLNASGNWVTSGTLVASHAGTQWFGSGNGSNNTFFNLHFKKALGGVVENRPYTVSFYVVLPEGGAIAPIELSDFSVLRIGGPTGTMSWTSTPSPTVSGVWVKWTGTYTPSVADVGGPFTFEMKFDLPSKHSMGVDGPLGIE